MLRTNKKAVQEKIKSHILEYYTAEELKHQADIMGQCSTYHNIVEMVQGGCFLVYYDDIREFLRETLEETEEEANRFDNQKVWDLYKHLIALNGSNVIVKLNELQKRQNKWNELAQ